MTNSQPVPKEIDQWIESLGDDGVFATLGFPEIYGDAPGLWMERRHRLLTTLHTYRARFGNEAVRIFRAPGRINLRGMHVDTHGGFLNLMTHQREVLVVAGLGDYETTKVVNTEDDFHALDLWRKDLPQREQGQDWRRFIEGDTVRDHVGNDTGHWRYYVEGVWLRMMEEMGETAVRGLHLAVDSNLPRGAALSSSAALCLAMTHAWLAWHDRVVTPEALILAAQDGEWFTGSRCGTCDQAAIVLGKPGQIIHGALNPAAFTTHVMHPHALPEALRILVVNSFTRRSISGAEKVAYTRNRFAYSMALDILAQTLRRLGFSETVIAQCQSLSEIDVAALGGEAALYRVMLEIPESLTVTALRTAYDLPDLEASFRRYFNDVAEADLPTTIALRGPLLFGIAESARARAFAQALDTGDYAYGGRLMTWGHDGDRRVDANGAPFTFSTDDEALLELMANQTPLVACPGSYGASSPALDWLVDRALQHGALGASLTGAGIAGSVLVLCEATQAEALAEGIRTAMASKAYQEVAGFDTPLSPDALETAVVLNQAVLGSGEIAGATC